MSLIAHRLKIIVNLMTVCIVLSNLTTVSGQDLESILEMPDEELDPGIVHSFVGTHVGNGQSSTIAGPGELNMFIGHRFGKLNSGFYQLYGIDMATMRFGFDYGFTPWFSAGFGRSTLEKTWDLFGKARLTGQSENDFPFTTTIFAGSSVNTLKYVYPEENDVFGNRLSYSVQAVFARNFKWFSIQLAPIYVHTGYDPRNSGSADFISAGTAARIRLTKRIDFTTEYYASILKPSDLELSNPLTLGFDLDTGGHLFQLVFSNSQGMAEKMMIANTTNSWLDGDIFFGFNMVRTFNMK